MLNLKKKVTKKILISLRRYLITNKQHIPKNIYYIHIKKHYYYYCHYS